MKKIILLVAIMFATLSFAQEDMRETSQAFGLELKVGTFSGLGAYYENYFLSEKSGKYSTIQFQGNYVATSTDTKAGTLTGVGTEFKVNLRAFLTKGKNHGFYYQNGLTYGSVKFDDNYTVLFVPQNFSGTYRYFSFFSPELGYDFLIAKKLVLNIHAGTQWQIELKGKGDIDNKDFDNWATQLGVRLGYKF